MSQTVLVYVVEIDPLDPTIIVQKNRTALIGRFKHEMPELTIASNGHCCV